jgi:hypothetical protein
VYLKKNQRRYESELERLISNSPIAAKHNPFYEGAFNGNDCFRLIENHELICKMLKEYAKKRVDDSSDEESTNKARSEEKEIISICERHELIWINLANLLPSLRSVRKLSRKEKDDLLDDIQTYWDSYIDNCSGSVTPKLHLLKEHLVRLLEFNGTVGLFAEDAMESIHAIINGLAWRYCALD